MKLRRIFTSCITIILLALTSVNATAGSKIKPPVGYTSFLSFMANGSYPSSTPHPTIPNCNRGFCFSDYFQTQVMKRDSSTIETLRMQAADFFYKRFAIDVNAPENQGRILFTEFMLDPRLNYRSYHISGIRVPVNGYEVRDGGWMLLVLDPEGFALGGEYSGQHAPVGSMFAYGEYNIALKSTPRHIHSNKEHRKNHNPYNYQKDSEIIISYRSGPPLIINSFGLIPFSCELSNNPLTENFPLGREGYASGFATTFRPDANGYINPRTRNILTFSERGGL